MEFHDAANIFPLDEENLGALAADIREHGQQVPIEVMGGKILDGRRRWLACELAGVTPKMRDVSPADPVAYVLSLNLHRRHLTPSQLSMVGARARKWYDDEAKKRMSEGGKAGGKGRPKQGMETLPSPNSGAARDQAGKAVGVSGRSIDYATKVIANAVPEVIQAVDEGRMAVDTAAILSTEPEEVQREEANRPKRNRTYQSVSKRRDAPSEPEPEPEPETNRKSRGVGVALANEAIDCLTRIPKNDALRKRGFQIVTDWIRHNQ
jgi:hypothetical protein